MGDVPKLGQLCDPSAGRDAVHVAIAPVTADEPLRPGERVSLVNGSRDRVWAARAGTPVGIIDPFLVHPVQAGERCWLLLFPGSVTSLRHLWTHPAFAVKVPVAKESAGE